MLPSEFIISRKKIVLSNKILQLSIEKYLMVASTISQE